MNNQTILTLLKFQLMNKKSVEITVAGSSMNPVLKDGDRIRIEHRDSYAIGDILVFSYKNQELLVHRLLQIKEGKYFCKGDNSMRLEDIAEDQILAAVENIRIQTKLDKVGRIGVGVTLNDLQIRHQCTVIKRTGQP